jgi:hypothetical protein
MIAICPTCHTHCHHGEMKIDEAVIRNWKKAKRNPSNTGYLYIEPGVPPRMLMGCIYWTRKDGGGAVIFRLSTKNCVTFRVIPGNILFVSLTLSDPVGKVIVELRENHLIGALREGVKLESHPGRLRITAPATSEFISQAIVNSYAASNPPAPLTQDDRLTLVDLQVLDIGTVQIGGTWIEEERAVIANADYLSLCTRGQGFYHMCGYGEVRGDKDLAKLPTVVFDGALDESVMSALLANASF